MFVLKSEGSECYSLGKVYFVVGTMLVSVPAFVGLVLVVIADGGEEFVR